MKRVFKVGQIVVAPLNNKYYKGEVIDINVKVLAVRVNIKGIYKKWCRMKDVIIIREK